MKSSLRSNIVVRDILASGGRKIPENGTFQTAINSGAECGVAGEEESGAGTDTSETMIYQNETATERWYSKRLLFFAGI